MKLYDPSEAVESSRVLRELHARFETLEESPYGGTLLHPVLKDIAHHFNDGSSGSLAILTQMFTFEDELMTSGSIQSDFSYGVYRKH
jgi:hypothetical protein